MARMHQRQLSAGSLAGGIAFPPPPRGISRSSHTNGSRNPGHRPNRKEDPKELLHFPGESMGSRPPVEDPYQTTDPVSCPIL